MIFLKVTTLVGGLLGASSFNYTATPMPDLPTCHAFLAQEVESTRRGAPRMTIDQSTGFVRMELNSLFDKFHATMECVDVEPKK